MASYHVILPLLDENERKNNPNPTPPIVNLPIEDQLASVWNLEAEEEVSDEKFPLTPQEKEHVVLHHKANETFQHLLSLHLISEQVRSRVSLVHYCPKHFASASLLFEKISRKLVENLRGVFDTLLAHFEVTPSENNDRFRDAVAAYQLEVEAVRQELYDAPNHLNCTSLAGVIRESKRAARKEKAFFGNFCL